MTDLRLAVIVGHSRLSPGAYSPSLGKSEYSINSGLAALMTAIEIDGVEVAVFTRDGHGVAGAYAMAADWGCHATVELHANSASAPEATGTETIRLPKSRRAVALAQAVQERMVAVLGLRDRGAKEPWKGRGLASLTALSVPAIITEPWFMSNAADCRRAMDRMPALAEAIVQGAMEWWQKAS